MHSIVIGGTKGIGREIVNTLETEKHKVSVIGRTNNINLSNFYKADITEWKNTELVLNTIVKKNGKINCIVFCQRFRGIGESWDGEISTSLTATRNIIEWSVDHYCEVGDKSIVIINSIASKFIATEQPSSYHTVKSALLGLAKFYAVKLGKLGIRVNSVSPTTTLKKESENYYMLNKPLQNLYKKIIPLGRMGNSKDVANAVSFLCSEKSSFITGQNIVVDGGLSLQGVESMCRSIANISRLSRII